jgi:hypothetical protein
LIDPGLGDRVRSSGTGWGCWVVGMGTPSEVTREGDDETRRLGGAGEDRCPACQYPVTEKEGILTSTSLSRRQFRRGIPNRRRSAPSPSLPTTRRFNLNLKLHPPNLDTIRSTHIVMLNGNRRGRRVGPVQGRSTRRDRWMVVIISSWVV